MKTKFQIKNRFTGEIQFELECETILDCLLAAIKEGANLKGANLEEANLDFSVMQFHCRHLKPKTDRRLRVQLAFHLASWMKHADSLSDDEKALLEILKPYANEFHRTDVERI